MSINQSFDFFIQWHLTEKCNLNCTHCYQSGRKPPEMSNDEISDTITEISELLDEWQALYGIDLVPSMNITGGEPLLRKNIFGILHEIRDAGFETYFLTNGILINKKTAGMLRKAGVKGVQVSIEGTERVHDRIRGEGSYSASIRGVNNLLDAGMTVTLNATISRFNAGQLMDLIELASGLGVQKLGFSRLVPSGRGSSMVGEMLGTAQIKKLYREVFSAPLSKGLQIVTGDPVASSFRDCEGNDESGDVPLGGCAAGVSGLTLMPDGTVFPCRRLPLSIGNVRQDSLREIWSTSPVLNDLRDRARYKGKCRTCQKWANCRGCRAIAYAYTAGKGRGDMLAPDPQCFL